MYFFVHRLSCVEIRANKSYSIGSRRLYSYQTVLSVCLAQSRLQMTPSANLSQPKARSLKLELHCHRYSHYELDFNIFRMIPKTGVIQNFAPLKQICAHLNAFHVYASDTSRCVEANHYCSHLNEGVQACSFSVFSYSLNVSGQMCASVLSMIPLSPMPALSALSI